jgi:hypothetical protein
MFKHVAQIDHVSGNKIELSWLTNSNHSSPTSRTHDVVFISTNEYYVMYAACWAVLEPLSQATGYGSCKNEDIVTNCLQACNKLLWANLVE